MWLDGLLNLNNIKWQELFGQIEGTSCQNFYAASDVHRFVSDPFTTIVDFHDNREKSKVNGHRLLQRQEFQPFFLDFHFYFINFIVHFYDSSGDIDISGLNRLDCLSGQLFNHGTKRENTFFYFFQFTIKKPSCRLPFTKIVSRFYFGVRF